MPRVANHDSSSVAGSRSISVPLALYAKNRLKATTYAIIMLRRERSRMRMAKNRMKTAANSRETSPHEASCCRKRLLRKSVIAVAVALY